MELSISTSVLFDPHFPQISTEKALERLAAAGYHVLDFDFNNWLFDGSPLVDDDWEQWFKSLRKRADSLAIRFGQAHGPIFNKLENSDKAKWLTKMSIRSLEAAALLGIRWVVFEPETLPGAFDSAHLNYMMQCNIDWFETLLPTAENTDVGIAIENVADVFGSKERGLRRLYCSVPSELIELVDRFNHRLMGICWDTGHANLQRIDQGKALCSIGNRLKATHIHDNSGERDEHLLPFYGNINWIDVMNTLQAINYKGDFTYEVNNFIRPLPDTLRDAALRYSIQIGHYLLYVLAAT